MNTISEHRKFLNDTLISRWAYEFNKNQLVYDIGKSTTWDYKPHFKCNFKTIDRNNNLGPDIHADLEYLISAIVPADGLILNGVFEQCENPWALMNGVQLILKKGGKILVGLASIGMQPYGESDKWRVTKDGALAYMKGFKILSLYTFPAYFIILGEKL